MLDIITKMINISTVYFFNFLKSNTVLNVLFTIIAVNKDLKYKFTSERERSIAWYNFPGKSSSYFAVTF